MSLEPQANNTRLAVLIDADNASAKVIQPPEDILSAIVNSNGNRRSQSIL